MNLTVIILGALVVIVIVGIAVLRIRKLRRDEIRQLASPVDRRLLTPPPSPYAPSKGFRLLDGPDDSFARTRPARPKLENDHEYVFSESQMPTYDDVRPVPLRHNETWALSRSSRRSGTLSGLRVAAIALVIVLLVGFVAYYLQDSPKNHGGTPTTTTSTTTSTTLPSTSTTLTTQS